MTCVRRVTALASGFVLYMVVVYLVGFLAAIAIPKAYFEFFGRQHATLALTLLDAATLALPSFMRSLVSVTPDRRPVSPRDDAFQHAGSPGLGYRDRPGGSCGSRNGSLDGLDERSSYRSPSTHLIL